jgi:cellulose synthase/poly-beta-1,6-N-acetylglucosamine synthase-like glycosyltransferase/4-amino-4-deoxy-L-arabinose transferase-like glycosyltransferase
MMDGHLGASIVTIPLFLGIDIFNLSLAVVRIVALLFGAYWIILNFYKYYPVVQAFVERRIERDDSPEGDATEKRRHYSRLGLIVVGIAGWVLALVLYLFSGTQPAGSALFWQLREYALVSALLSIPAIGVNVALVFQSDRRTRVASLLGSVICVIAVGWLMLVYPFEWTAAGNDIPVISTYIAGLTLLLISTGSTVTRTYRRSLGEVTSYRQLRRFSGVIVGIGGGVLALGLFLFSGTQPAGSDLFWQLREYALVFAALALPAIALNLVTLLSVSRRKLVASLFGSALCAIAVGWFMLVYPFEWTAAGNDIPVISTYVVGLSIPASTAVGALLTRYGGKAHPVTPRQPLKTEATQTDGGQRVAHYQIVEGAVHVDTPLVEHPDPEDHPTIDVLLPAYEEAEVIHQAIESICTADYPDDRLTLYIILEADDDETPEALAEVRDRFDFDVLTIPEAYPGDPNKPRALNYGFNRSDGDIVGIIDAEDIVEEDIFDKATTAFVDDEADYALGKLDMVNEDDGWLNTLFRAEYGHWYRVIVPAYAQIGYPIPLGGASCFFRRSVLSEVSDVRIERHGHPWRRQAEAEDTSDEDTESWHGDLEPVPWDPRNVTEDFELGLLLWQEGYDFEFLDTVVREESPPDLDGWIRQRTRWQKGKLYTFFQYLSKPPSGIRPKFHLYWQSLVPHLGPINVGGFVIVLFIAIMAGYQYTPIITAVLALGLAFAFTTAGTYTYGYWVSSEQSTFTRLRRGIITLLTALVYWFLQWGADHLALRKMYSGRFAGQMVWEKTVHHGRNSVEAGKERVEIAKNSTNQRSLNRTTEILAFGLVLLAGLGLRLYDLDRWSLWIDEIYTISIRASQSIPELLVVPSDPHPPLYFILVHFWLLIFEPVAEPMRLLSIIFSIGTIVGVYLLGKELYDSYTGLLAALLVALSTLHIHQGRNIRMYSLFTFLAVGSWYAFLRSRSGSQKGIFGYILFTSAMFYTHIYGMFVFGSQLIYLLLHEFDRATRRRLATLCGYVLILAVPWAIVFGQQVIDLISGAADGVAVNWIPQASTALLRDTALLFAGFPANYPILAGTDFTWGVAIVLLFVYAVLLPFSILTFDSQEDANTYYLVDTDQAGLLLVWLLAVIGIPLLVSYLIVPVYFPRFAITASIPLYLLVSRGVGNIPTPRWRVIFIGLLIVSSGILVGGYYEGKTVEDWRGVTNQLEGDVASQDALIFEPAWIEGRMAYYYDGPQVERAGVSQRGALTPQEREALQSLAADRDSIWVMQYQPESSTPTLDLLRETHVRVNVLKDGEIAVYLFERG